MPNVGFPLPFHNASFWDQIHTKAIFKWNRGLAGFVDAV